jgi:hypothetical protein
MKTIVCLLTLALLTGCSSSKPPRPKAESAFSPLGGAEPARPSNSAALGLSAHTDPTPAEVARLQHVALAAYNSVFGGRLPKAFVLDAPAIGWFTKEGQLKQLRAAAGMSRRDFHAGFPVAKWTEIAVPPEYVSTMQLPASVSKADMTCYIGEVGGKPAYLFWSETAESTLLVVDV